MLANRARALESDDGRCFRLHYKPASGKNLLTSLPTNAACVHGGKGPTNRLALRRERWAGSHEAGGPPLAERQAYRR